MSYVYQKQVANPANKFQPGDRVRLIKPQMYLGKPVNISNDGAPVGTELVVVLQNDERTFDRPHSVCRLAYSPEMETLAGNKNTWSKTKWVDEECLELVSDYEERLTAEAVAEAEMAVLLGLRPTVEKLVEIIENADAQWNSVTRRTAVSIAESLLSAPIWKGVPDGG